MPARREDAGFNGGNVDPGDLDHGAVPGDFAFRHTDTQAGADLLHDGPVVHARRRRR